MASIRIQAKPLVLNFDTPAAGPDAKAQLKLDA